jgi:hypothetical protein
MKMKIAKADKQDIRNLTKYLNKLEARGGKDFPFGWRRVIWGADVLIENCCDPQEDSLEYSPYLTHNHVAPEQ